jgi:hypothetical protein
MLEGMRGDDAANFYLEVTPFNNEPTIDQIEAAAKMVGVNLEEHVYFRHDGDPSSPVRTRTKVPVGYLHIRRLQQILSKKTSYSTDVSKRSQVTGQLIGESKVGRLADEEAYALRTIGATYALKEFLGPPADVPGHRPRRLRALRRAGRRHQESARAQLPEHALPGRGPPGGPGKRDRPDAGDRGQALAQEVSRPLPFCR